MENCSDDDSGASELRGWPAEIWNSGGCLLRERIRRSRNHFSRRRKTGRGRFRQCSRAHLQEDSQKERAKSEYRARAEQLQYLRRTEQRQRSDGRAERRELQLSGGSVDRRNKDCRHRRGRKSGSDLDQVSEEEFSAGGHRARTTRLYLERSQQQWFWQFRAAKREEHEHAV